mmetsp:Transcript_4556/g.6314  ORF Transcript_4556/g.6314 Transcript_4556/m.6314 type:complete len:301 (-) Transcript_4556:1667-2569(-)
MRLVPHSSCKDNLHLLASREGRQAVVCSELTVKTTILQMLFDILRGKRTDIETRALSDLEINCLHCLVPSHLFERLLGQVFTRVNSRASISNFVLVLLGLVSLTSSNKLSNNLFDLRDLTRFSIDELDFKGRLLELLFLLGELHCNLDEGLLVLSIVCISPADVFVWRLVEVALNVMEGMLGNVGDTSIWVLPDISLLGLNLSDQQLDHSRLSGSVLSDASNTRRQGDLHRNVEKSWLVVYRVGERTSRHLHEGLSLRLDSLDGTWLGELELLLGRGKREVRTGIGVDLYKLIEVTLEST